MIITFESQLAWIRLLKRRSIFYILSLKWLVMKILITGKMILSTGLSSLCFLPPFSSLCGSERIRWSLFMKISPAENEIRITVGSHYFCLCVWDFGRASSAHGLPDHRLSADGWGSGSSPLLSCALLPGSVITSRITYQKQSPPVIIPPLHISPSTNHNKWGDVQEEWERRENAVCPLSTRGFSLFTLVMFSSHNEWEWTL